MKAALASSAWAAHAAVGARHWRRLTRDVERGQTAHLLRVLHANEQTSFGREHRLGRITSAADYASRVPIRGYEEFTPYIERIAAGEPTVLTQKQTRHFGLSSGTTTASKLIPYTDGLLAEFQRGIAPWVYRVFRGDPRLLASTTYWSITPVDPTRRTTPAGIPVGFDDDRSYVDRLTRFVLETLMPVPSAVARIDDIDAFRYTTLRLLLQQRDLGWLSVWSPSFLTLLMEPLIRWSERLVEDVERGTVSVGTELPAAVVASARARPDRADELRAIFSSSREVDTNGRTVYERIWPRLRLISCWAHGSAATLVPTVRRQFPNVAIQPKGLLATEGFVSFPYRDDLSALALSSHFFEFIDAETDQVVLAHELVSDRAYSVLLTTSGGLYRYRLGDLVEVGGFVNGCPLLRFLGKEDDVSDLHGEKLNERFVRACGEELFARHSIVPTFWLVAPQGSTQYTLYVQVRGSLADTSDLGDSFDELLRRNYHYDYCRRLGQLDRCGVFLIADAVDAPAAFLARRTEQGQRLGDVKPAVLDRLDDWRTYFVKPRSG